MRIKNQSGFTLLELLVTMALSSVLFLMVSSQYAMVTRTAFNNRVESTSKELAQILLDQITYDLSMAGAGMPLGQLEFKINNGIFGNRVLPVLPSNSGANQIQIRIPSRGRKSLLVTNLSLASSPYYFNVVDASDFRVGDVVYLNNASAGGDQGLYGEIGGISGDQITLSNSSLVPIVSTTNFYPGSMITPMRTVSYSVVGGDLIRSDHIEGDIALAPVAALNFTYFAEDGSQIALPLDHSKIANLLASIEVELEIQLPDRNGVPVSFTATKRVPLFNVINARR